MHLPRPRGKRIGLLGGSFNPAHAGHLFISRMALRLLGLDEIWWLVSPQNPLKTKKDMAPLEDRLAAARNVARDIRITPTDIETKLGTQYTVDTLKALKKHYPQAKFVWLMGTDNLVQLHQWKNWQEIFELVPIAVFDRATGKPRHAQAAKQFARAMIAETHARELALIKPPVWMFLHTPRHPASSTAIRKAAKGT